MLGAESALAAAAREAETTARSGFRLVSRDEVTRREQALNAEGVTRCALCAWWYGGRLIDGTKALALHRRMMHPRLPETSMTPAARKKLVKSMQAKPSKPKTEPKPPKPPKPKPKPGVVPNSVSPLVGQAWAILSEEGPLGRQVLAERLGTTSSVLGHAIAAASRSGEPNTPTLLTSYYWALPTHTKKDIPLPPETRRMLAYLEEHERATSAVLACIAGITPRQVRAKLLSARAYDQTTAHSVGKAYWTL